jgi:hypothetical protein
MRFFAPFIAVGLVCSLALPTIAQERMPPISVQSERNNEVLGTVVQGNTTIVFESAGSLGIELEETAEMGSIRREHPKIAIDLAYRPSLIGDSRYLSKHSELTTFFQAYPDIKDAMEENPGNFVAIPPRPGE